MNQINIFIKNLSKKIRPVLKKHAPDICLAIGIGAGGYALYSCATETPKAAKYIEFRKNELKTEKLPPVDIIRTAWKCYPKTVIAEALSITALVAGNRIGAHYNAGLAAALAISDATLVKYRDKVSEVIGEKAEQELAKPIMKEKEAQHVYTPFVDMDDFVWCKDYYTGKCFWVSRSRLLSAVNTLNMKLVNEMRASYNEFLDLIDVDICGFGQDHEWDINDGALELIFEEGEMDSKTKKTPTVIRFNRDPKRYSTVF